MNIIERKFSSGNNVSVSRITLTREEYKELLETHCIVPRELLEAVAHIGIDFGYGKYELDQEHIDNARELLQSLNKE